jgi:5-methylcytosine-specific restriction endonuclease McrA
MTNWTETAKFYATDFWKELSRKVRIRDRWTCTFCGKVAKSDYQRRLMQAHHVISRPHVSTRTDLDRESNLVTSCESCHKLIHGRIGVAGAPRPSNGAKYATTASMRAPRAPGPQVVNKFRS